MFYLRHKSKRKFRPVAKHPNGPYSVVGVVTLWTRRSGNQISLGEIFYAYPDQPWSLLYRRYRLIPRVKLLGCVVDHAPPSGAKVKERVVLYFLPPCDLFYSELCLLPLPKHLHCLEMHGVNRSMSSCSLTVRDRPQYLLGGRHSVFQQWWERERLKSQLFIQSAGHFAMTVLSHLNIICSLYLILCWCLRERCLYDTLFYLFI
jgi:hypothetical protein